MAGTASAETIAFRDELAQRIIEYWPDDLPPGEEALRWAIAAATRTWQVQHVRCQFPKGVMSRMMVQSAWEPTKT